MPDHQMITNGNHEVIAEYVSPATTPRQPDETRVVLVRPGDVLVIGGLREAWPDALADLATHLRETVGLAGVVIAEDDASIAVDHNAAGADRVRETCQAVRDREGPAGMINAAQILGLLSPTWPDGNYEAPAPTDGDDRS